MRPRFRRSGKAFWNWTRNGETTTYEFISHDSDGLRANFREVGGSPTAFLMVHLVSLTRENGWERIIGGLVRKQVPCIGCGTKLDELARIQCETCRRKDAINSGDVTPGCSDGLHREPGEARTEAQAADEENAPGNGDSDAEETRGDWSAAPAAKHPVPAVAVIWPKWISGVARAVEATSHVQHLERLAKAFWRPTEIQQKKAPIKPRKAVQLSLF